MSLCAVTHNFACTLAHIPIHGIGMGVVCHSTNVKARGQPCLWNIPLYHVTMYRYDWFNEEADWPMTKQDKVRRDSQTGNDGKKGGVRNCKQMQREAR